MPICNSCQNEIEECSVYCTSCGVKVDSSISCKHCGVTLTPGSKFCTSCGCPVNQDLEKTIESTQSAKEKTTESIENKKLLSDKVIGLSVLAIFLMALGGYFVWKNADPTEQYNRGQKGSQSRQYAVPNVDHVIEEQCRKGDRLACDDLEYIKKFGTKAPSVKP